MLSLTLTEGEYVMIGNNVRVVLDELNYKGVAVLAIDAPKEALILRGKHYEAEIEKMINEGNGAAQELREYLNDKWLARFHKHTGVATKNPKPHRRRGGNLPPETTPRTNKEETLCSISQ